MLVGGAESTAPARGNEVKDKQADDDRDWVLGSKSVWGWPLPVPRWPRVRLVWRNLTGLRSVLTSARQNIYGAKPKPVQHRCVTSPMGSWKNDQKFP